MKKYNTIVERVADATMLRFHYSQNATHSWLQSKYGNKSWENETMIGNSEFSHMMLTLKAAGWKYRTDRPTPIDTIYFFTKGE